MFEYQTLTIKKHADRLIIFVVAQVDFFDYNHV